MIIPILNRWLVITPIREEVLEREQAFVRARGTVALCMQPLASRVRDHRLPEFKERVQSSSWPKDKANLLGYS